MSYTRGVSRDQLQMPAYLDEVIAKDNPVRLIDEFVNGLDMIKLGIASPKPKNTGRPPYANDDMTKLWLYGYCNSLLVTRRLEMECYRNLEMMWLVNNITPDHSSIATFRKENSKFLKNVFREFSFLCIKWDLVGCELIVVDGTKIKVNNSKHNNYSQSKLEKKIKEIEEKIEKYLSQIEASDNDNILETEEKILTLTERRQKYNEYLDTLKSSGETQLSTTDKDARLMDNKQGGASMGYNIQATVDAKNHIVLDVKVTNHPTDQSELSKMRRRAKRILKLKNVTAMADKGYYNGKDLAKCKLYKIKAIVPRQAPPKRNGEDGYTMKDFTYVEESNSYICPMGNMLLCRSSSETKCPTYENRDACRGCENINKCTKNKNGYRQIIHSEYFAVQREADKLFEENKKLFKKRQEIVEHVFGTVKYYLGFPQLLLRTKKKVTGEVCLLFFSYNFKRVMNIMGFDEMMARLKEASRIFFEIFARNQPIYVIFACCGKKMAVNS